MADDAIARLRVAANLVKQSASTLTIVCDSTEPLTFQSLSLALFARADW